MAPAHGGKQAIGTPEWTKSALVANEIDPPELGTRMVRLAAR